MDKEKLIAAGQELKAFTTKEHKVKVMMDGIINNYGRVSDRDTADDIISSCLLGEIECQEMINVLNGPDEDRRQAIKYFLAGYCNN